MKTTVRRTSYDTFWERQGHLVSVPMLLITHVRNSIIPITVFTYLLSPPSWRPGDLLAGPSNLKVNKNNHKTKKAEAHLDASAFSNIHCFSWGAGFYPRRAVLKFNSPALAFNPLCCCMKHRFHNGRALADLRFTEGVW